MNRPFTIFMLLCSLLSCLALTPTAQAGDWEHRPDLGGWLDKETGLVWGQLPDDFYTSLDPANPRTGMTWSWYGVRDIFMPAYKSHTGFGDWRMPTPSEGTTAVSHGLVGTVIPADAYWIGWGSFWTSERSGKYAKHVFVSDGRIESLWHESSGLYPGGLLVRNAVPVSSGPGKKGK